MARLIRKGPEEKHKYPKLMLLLPAYCSIGFDIKLQDDTSGDDRICDCMMVVPHIGVILMNVHNTGSDQDTDAEEIIRDLQSLNSKIMTVRKYIKEKFLITPYVFGMVCLPEIGRSSFADKNLSDSINTDLVLFREDLISQTDLMSKLMDAKKRIEPLYKEAGIIDDLSDSMVHNISFYWKSGILVPERPERPPLVFLSYRSLNQVFAGEIKSELERRGIYVWRAPEDVPISDYYKDVETEAIRNCDVFFFLVSTSSQRSEEVRYEFDKAREENKPILPLWIDDCETDEYYSSLKDQHRIMRKMDLRIMDDIEKFIRKTKNENLSADGGIHGTTDR